MDTPNQPSRQKPVIALISLYVAENNGVRFLAAALRQAGFRAVEIYFKDYIHHNFKNPSAHEVRLLLNVLRQQEVSLAGISLRAGGYLKLASSLTRTIKKELNLPVLWGGMHVTMSPEECLEHSDLIALGECEKVIVDLAQCLWEGRDPRELASIWSHNDDGSVRRNALRPLEQNLDTLPRRDFHSHKDKFWINDGQITQGDPYTSQTVYLMMTARGCLFNCSYCDVSALRKRYQGLGCFYRHMSPQAVVEECLYARTVFPKLKRFRFDDELFCLQENWVEEFAALYSHKVGLPFEILTDPRVVRPETLRLLKKAGLDTVMMGIQNIASVNAKLYNRHVSDAEVLQAARTLHALRLKPCYQILLDDSHVSSSEKEALFQLLCRLPRPLDLYFFSLSYWPGTETTRLYLEDGSITPDDVEGRNDKCLKQFRVDLAWPRSKEDVFWTSLYTLLSKPLPLSMVQALSRSAWLRRHPEPLRLLAQLLNLLKLATLALGMLRRGELTWDVIKRWVNFKSLATS